jgi:Family of unknown function (DUF695)
VDGAAGLDPRAVDGGAIVEYEVVIPDEVYAVLEWQQDDLPAVCVVNQSLAAFEPKIEFAWHLSIIVECVDLAGNGMSTNEEVSVLDRFGDDLDENLKADGNALFLARITWNGRRQFLYRVYDPELANRYLTDLIEGHASPREFEFRMEHDEAWRYAIQFLSHWDA